MFFIMASGIMSATLRAAEKSSARPNMLIVIGDDCTFSDLPLYGGTNIRTPHLQQLAKQSLTFNRAYLTSSMCVTCRTELYTGLYPMDSGACWNHSQAKPGTKSMVQRLEALGYRVGIAGKVDVRPRESFPFEMVDGFERNCVATTANYNVAGIRQFMSRDDKQPFALVVGLVVPHCPWTVGDPSHFKPKTLKLPPYLVDTPETRHDYSHYFAEMEVMDQQVGDILKTLDTVGKAKNTLVLFTSEQGGQFPGCKWTNWDQGLHTALIARWPGHIKPDQRTDAMVMYCDVLPTLIEAAGAKPDADQFDGTSFLDVLESRTDSHRQYTFGMHNNLPEGTAYPIRSVCDEQFRYIRNLEPNELFLNKWIMTKFEHNSYWPSWIWVSSNRPHARALVQRYMLRPAEELYDLKNDPWEMHNLIDDTSFASVHKRLSTALDRWMAQQKDPGAALDTRAAFDADIHPNKPADHESGSGHS